MEVPLFILIFMCNYLSQSAPVKDSNGIRTNTSTDTLVKERYSQIRGRGAARPKAIPPTFAPPKFIPVTTRSYGRTTLPSHYFPTGSTSKNNHPKGISLPTSPSHAIALTTSVPRRQTTDKGSMPKSTTRPYTSISSRTTQLQTRTTKTRTFTTTTTPKSSPNTKGPKITTSSFSTKKPTSRPSTSAATSTRSSFDSHSLPTQAATPIDGFLPDLEPGVSIYDEYHYEEAADLDIQNSSVNGQNEEPEDMPIPGTISSENHNDCFEMEVENRNQSGSYRHRFKRAPISEKREIPENDQRCPPSKRSKSVPPPRCSMLISEYFAGATEATNDEFMELQFMCESRSGPKPRNPFTGYHVLLFRCSPQSIVLTADIGAADITIRANEGYIVLGADSVQLNNVNLRHPPIISSYQRKPSSLPVSDDSAYALLLIYDMSKVNMKIFNLHNEDTSFIPKSITAHEIQKLKPNLKDMIIFGKAQHGNEACADFNDLWPDPVTPRETILVKSNEDSNSFRDGKSISKCFNFQEGFRPDDFFSAISTPGLANDCSSGQSLTEIYFDKVISRPSVNQVCPRSNHVPTMDQEFCEQKSFHQTIYVELQKKEILTANQATHELLKKCKKLLPQKEDVLQISGIQDWLSVVFVSPDECHFSCNYCKSYFHFGFRPDIKRKHKIMKQAGFFTANPHENMKKIKSHPSNEHHIKAAELAEVVQHAQLQSVLDTKIVALEKEEYNLYEPTINLVRIVYAEMYSGLSFKSHETLTKAIAMAGASIGFHHRSDVACQQILTVISEEFHRKLLEYIVKHVTPFSIIVDTTTNQQEALLIIFMQVLEDGYPVIHFFGLVHLTEGEKALAMATSFTNRILADDSIQPGFLSAFKSQIVSIVSDSASVMVGNSNSFHVHVQNFIGREIPVIKCFAHKLDLAVKNGLKPSKEEIKAIDAKTEEGNLQKSKLMYFQNFEKNNNEFFRFYSGRAHKKWNHLRNMALDLGFTPYKFRYFYDIRWSDSHYQAMDVIEKNYDMVSKDLEDISNDPDFDSISQEDAENLIQKITDKTYAIVVREFLDFLQVFKILSKNFQESAGILSAKSGFVLETLQKLHQLKNSIGEKVHGFLTLCSCNNVCEQGHCTLNQYDGCKEVEYKELILKENNVLGVKLSEVREKLYNALISEILKYFDMKQLQAFEIFNPGLMLLETVPDRTALDMLYKPSIENSFTIPINSNGKFDLLCSFYKMSADNCLTLKEDWRSLLVGIYSDPFMQNLQEKDPAKFWPIALMQVNLPWTRASKEFVSRMLVTPFTSSDCERGFSYVNSLRSKERHGLTTKVLESRVRVKANGPANLDNFDAYSYARKFLTVYTRVDEAGFRGGRPFLPQAETNFFKESRIYSAGTSRK